MQGFGVLLPPFDTNIKMLLNCDSRDTTYLPLENSQRGDSGTIQMRQTWRTEGSACKAEGMRHDQLSGILKVPNVFHDTRELPTITERLFEAYRPCGTESCHVNVSVQGW